MSATPPPFGSAKFLALGLEVARYHGWERNKQEIVEERFRKHFGISAQTCADLWQFLQETERLPSKARPILLLMTIRWLRKYETEEDLASFFGIKCPQTVRVHVRGYEAIIADVLQEKVGCSGIIIVLNLQIVADCVC